jgi:hypothetical protein
MLQQSIGLSAAIIVTGRYSPAAVVVSLVLARAFWAN